MCKTPRFIKKEIQGHTKDQQEDKDSLGSLTKGGIPETAVWPSGEEEK